jgi:hypothetical protein
MLDHDLHISALQLWAHPQEVARQPGYDKRPAGARAGRHVINDDHRKRLPHQPCGVAAGYQNAITRAEGDFTPSAIENWDIVMVSDHAHRVVRLEHPAEDLRSVRDPRRLAG